MKLSIGFWRKSCGKIDWSTEFSIIKALCQCYILTIGPVCVEWLSDYCKECK